VASGRSRSRSLGLAFKLLVYRSVTAMGFRGEQIKLAAALAQEEDVAARTDAPSVAVRVRVCRDSAGPRRCCQPPSLLSDLHRGVSHAPAHRSSGDSGARALPAEPSALLAGVALARARTRTPTPPRPQPGAVGHRRRGLQRAG